jgi:NADH dehydrogenase
LLYDRSEAGEMADNHRVIIIGGGFGGLRAAQAFKGAPVDVTLIDKRNFHLFQPLLYQVATGSLSPGEIAAPLRSVLSRQENTRVLLGDVVDVDPASKTVRLADGAQLEYDSLIVATGSQTSYYGHDEWREWAPSLKSVEEATGVRHRIFYAFEVAERASDPARRRAWLTFVIVGAGPTGVEMAGAIAQIARETLKHDFRSIRPEEAQIILMDGAPRVLPPFPEKLSRKATQSLARLGVEVRTGVMVKAVDKEGVTYQGPDGLVRLDARTVIWGGGVAVTPLARTLATRTQAETDKGGRIKVGPDLTIAGHPDIYVVGDMALAIDATSGKPLPGLVQVAMQEGTHAAKDIVRKVRGKPPLPPFEYFDKGTMAVIGRWRAVANVFGVPVWGLPAWIVWAFIHLVYLAQFEMRALVFVQWLIQDLTFGRGARLITGVTPSDFFQGDGGASGTPVPPDDGPKPGAVAAAAAAPHAKGRTTTRVSSPPSGTLTVLGLIAVGALPVLAFTAWLLSVAGVTVPLPGGGNIPSILAPASGQAKSLFDLGLFVFAVTGTIFVVVFALLTTAITRFRETATNADREPPQVYGSTQIELAWTIIPCLIVLVLFLATARVIHAVQDAPKPPGALDVTAVGHQFWWEFRYPGLGIVTANELHIPVSDPGRPRPTYLKLLSADTDHSFWIPELGGKTDLIPNRVNQMWFDPHRTGVFLGQCAQYCGTQHGKMLLRVVVDSDQDFETWVRAQKQPAARDEQVAAGRRVFETTACLNCHAVAGTPANGRFGPDLTHLMSRSTIASGAGENTRENLRRWIEDPDSIKPGSLMPAMKVADADLDALVAYMQSLR